MSGDPPQLGRDRALLVTSACAAVWWLSLLGWGHADAVPFDWDSMRDWLAALREAVQYRQLPLYGSMDPRTAWARIGDNRPADFLLWGSTHFPIFPWVVFLALGAPLPMVVILTYGTYYLAGVCGIGALARRYALSTPRTLLLFVLLMCNGWLTTRLCVWHHWGVLFLFPWFIYYLFRAAEGERGNDTVAGVALVLGLIAWSGHLLMLLIVALFVALVGVVPWMTWWVVRVGVLSAVLAAGRILPVLAVWPTSPRAQLAPYESWTMLWYALTGGPQVHAQWWEYDAYWGPGVTWWIVGCASLALLARDRRQRLRQWILLGPLALTICWTVAASALPVWQLSWAWAQNTVPGLGLMRGPSRLIVVPYVILAASAVIAEAAETQRMRPLLRDGVMAAFVVYVALGFMLHAPVWCARNIPTPPVQQGRPAAYLWRDPEPLHEILTDSDCPPGAHCLHNVHGAAGGRLVVNTALYRIAAWIGVGLSACGAIFAGWLLWRPGVL